MGPLPLAQSHRPRHSSLCCLQKDQKDTKKTVVPINQPRQKRNYESCLAGPRNPRGSIFRDESIWHFQSAKNPGHWVLARGRLLTLLANHIRVRDGWREDACDADGSLPKQRARRITPRATQTVFYFRSSVFWGPHDGRPHIINDRGPKADATLILLAAGLKFAMMDWYSQIKKNRSTF